MVQFKWLILPFYHLTLFWLILHKQDMHLLQHGLIRSDLIEGHVAFC